jgi:hypothetical protein
MNISIDKAGNLKLGTRKCSLCKKDDVVRAAKRYGVPNAEKKTVDQLCSSIKARVDNKNDTKQLKNLILEQENILKKLGISPTRSAGVKRIFNR